MVNDSSDNPAILEVQPLSATNPIGNADKAKPCPAVFTKDLRVSMINDHFMMVHSTLEYTKINQCPSDE